MATEVAIKSARQELREQIVTLASSSHFDRPGKFEHAVYAILEEVLDALDRLDDGEAPLAFKPSDPVHKSVGPAETAKLRLQAVAYVSALKRRGVPLPEATEKIAEAFQRKEDAVKKWRDQELKRAKSSVGTAGRNVDLATLVSLDKFALRMGHGLSIKQIIKKAKDDGNRHQILQPNYAKGSKK